MRAYNYKSHKNRNLVSIITKAATININTVSFREKIVPLSADDFVIPKFRINHFVIKESKKITLWLQELELVWKN